MAPQNPYSGVLADTELPDAVDPAEAPNPYRAIAEQQDAAERQRLAIVQQQAQKENPDARAEAMKIAAQTGIPADSVARNLDELKVRSGTTRRDLDAVRAQTPALAAWASTPDNAAVSHDDMDAMGNLEWVLTAPGRAFAQQLNSIRAAELRYKGLFTPLSREEQDKLSGYRYHATLGGDLGASYFGTAVTGAGRLLAQSIDPAKYALVGGLEGLAIGAAGGALIGGGVGAVPGALATAAVTARAGMLYGVVKSTAMQETADAYDEFLAFTDEAGQPIDTGVARIAALSVGAFNGLVEATGFEKVISRFPGLDKLSGKASRSAIAAALKNPTVRRGFAQLAKDYGATIGIEAATEVSQRAVTILGGELGKLAQPLDIAPRSTADIWDDLVMTGVRAIPEFALGLAPGPMIGLAQNAHRAKKAEQGVALFTALSEGVAQSKTGQRLPAALESFVAQATKDGPLADVYAPLDTWATYWQGKGIDPAQMAAEVTGRPDAYAQAQHTGSLVIPTARYAVTLAGSEHAGFFASELRVGPDEMNGREMEAFRVDVEAMQARAKDAAAATPAEQAQRQIVDDIEAQLIATGSVSRETARTSAQAMAGIGNLAERAGFDPAEVYQSWGVQVRRPGVAEVPASATTMAQAPPPKMSPQGEVSADDELSAIPGFAAMAGATAGRGIELAPDEGLATNASGESAASQEALNRQASMTRAKEAFVVYDRAGRRRALTGPEAVDYRPSRGETYGVEGPSGFQLREDNGGRVPARTTSATFEQSGFPGAAGAVRALTTAARGRAMSVGLRDLMERLEAPGEGATVDLATGLETTSGYSVALPGHEQQLAAAEATVDALAAYLDLHWDALSVPGQQLGLWHDGEAGIVYFDVSVTTDTRAEAIDLALDARQEAFYDHAARSAVRLATDVDAVQRAAERLVARPADRAVGATDGPAGNAGRDREGQSDSGGAGAVERGSRAELSAAPQAVSVRPPAGVGRPPVDARARQDAQRYAREAVGHAHLTFDYPIVDESRARRIAAAYEALPDDDSANPTVRAAYEALVREVRAQWDFAIAQGMAFEPWLAEGQPYQNSAEMLADITERRHLFFYTGGEPHPFLSGRDETLYSANEQLRAIHDYYAHAAGGFGFGPRGEEAAWRAHLSMFSGLAAQALTTETRGQNSWVNFGTHNYDADGARLPIPLADRPYATQKVALLPDEFSQADEAVPAATFFQSDTWGQIVADAPAESTRRVFYSRLDRAIEESKLTKANGVQWKQTIKNAKVGVNKDEFALARLEDLDGGTVYTKDEVLAYLKLNRPRIGLVILEGKGAPSDEAIEERAQQIRDRMEQEVMESLDWSDIVGEAIAIEDEIEDTEEVEVEVEQGTGTFDEDGNEIMETVTETEERETTRTVYYPGRQGGAARRADGSRRRYGGYGIKDQMPDSEWYEDEGDAIEAAEKWLDELKDEDEFRESAYEAASEAVDWSEAEREARRELEGEGAGGEDATQFGEYVLGDEMQDHASYREVFITATAAAGRRTLDQVAQDLFGKTDGTGRQITYDGLLSDAKAEVQRARMNSTPTWSDGHSNYDHIDNPIVRLRLNVRADANPIIVERPIVVDAPTEAYGATTATRWTVRVEGETQHMRSFETEDEARAFVTANPIFIERRTENFLFLEEVQPPKEHQQPKMPPVYLKNWREIGFKWALRYAAENGLAGVAWTTGQQQADRYGIAKHVKLIAHTPLFGSPPEHLPTATKAVTVVLKSGGAPIDLILDAEGKVLPSQAYNVRDFVDHGLDEIIGKELATQILEATEPGEIERQGLQIGGAGLMRLYDVDFRNVAQSIPAIKKHKGRVGTIDIMTKAETTVVEVEVTPRAHGFELGKDDDALYPATYRYDVVNDDGTVLFSTEVGEKGEGRALSNDAYRWQQQHRQLPHAQPALRITPEMKEAIMGGQPFLQKPTAAAPRGAIQFGPNRTATINLFERADLSTFLHETGHLYLEVMGDLVDRLAERDAATLTPEQRQLTADYATILGHLGVRERSALGVEQHELFARSFEAYLMTGKAPSLALREAFSRFRAWLLGIYRNLAALNAPLTDDVRQVFDRMLATDAAIAEAEAEGSLTAIFTTPEEAGMTHERFALYRDAVAQASARARETIDARLMADVQREQTAQWKARKAAIKAEVEAETYAKPVYRALAAITRGTNPDGTAAVEGEAPVPMRLSKKLIVDQFGPERLRTIPKHLYSAEGGVDPGVVADLYGFSSGDELLKTISGTPPMRVSITREVEARMLAEHGSLLLDGTLHEKAQLAVADETRDAILREELKALAALERQTRPFTAAVIDEQRRERAYERRWLEAEAKLRIAIAEGHKQVEIDALRAELSRLKAQARGGAARVRGALPSRDAVKAQAQASLATMRIGDVRPQLYWGQARRASQAAVEAAARQDFAGAIVAKQQELISLAYFRESSKVLEDVARRVKAARALAEPASLARLMKAGQSYHDQVAGVLDRFEFAQVPQSALDRRASLRKWAEGQEAQGVPVDLPDGLLDEAKRTNYRDLSVEELIGVTDGLKQLLHLARLKNKLLSAQAKRTLDATCATIGASIRAHGTPIAKGARDRGAKTERTRAWQGILAAHRKLGSIVREMDGFADGGPLWDALMRPLNDAGAREAEMTAQATTEFFRLYETAFPGNSKRELYAKAYVPAVEDSLSKMERLAIALNWGNEGNRDRVKRAEGWSDAQVQAVLETLSTSDMEFVQGVFDFLNSYWSQIAAKQERVFGVRPEKVEAAPITTSAGTFRGGYYPLKYDDRLSARASQMLDLDAANLAKSAAYVKATTSRGHTKERVATLDLPVRRDFGPMFEHVQQVIHDLTHHEALIDVGRILAHKEVQTAIYETYGDITYKTIKDTIKDVAFGDAAAIGAMEKALNHLRAGATVVGLGWNLTTAALQPLGLANSVVRIGARGVALGVGRWLGPPKRMTATVEWIYEQSTFMRTRGLTQQREINEIRNRVGVYSGQFSSWVEDALSTVTADTVTKQGIADSYFYFIQKMQQVVDVPTWLGAYQIAKESGETDERAVALADQAVIDSQGGGQTKDLAGVQRGTPMMKLFTNFYSYFSVVYNQAVESTKRTKWQNPASVGRLAVDYVMLFIVPATLGDIIRKAMTGDDEWDLEAMVRNNVAYLMGTMVGLRELGGAIQGYYGYEGPAGSKAFAAASRLIQQSSQAIKSGDPADFDAAFFRALNDTMGSVFHYPAGQARRTVEGIAALAEGRTENPLVIFTGAPK